MHTCTGGSVDKLKKLNKIPQNITKFPEYKMNKSFIWSDKTFNVPLFLFQNKHVTILNTKFIIEPIKLDKESSDEAGFHLQSEFRKKSTGSNMVSSNTLLQLNLISSWNKIYNSLVQELKLILKYWNNIIGKTIPISFNLQYNYVSVAWVLHCISISATNIEDLQWRHVRRTSAILEVFFSRRAGRFNGKQPKIGHLSGPIETFQFQCI
jgi:hypothetical protein